MFISRFNPDAYPNEIDGVLDQARHNGFSFKESFASLWKYVTLVVVCDFVKYTVITCIVLTLFIA